MMLRKEVSSRDKEESLPCVKGGGFAVRRSRRDCNKKRRNKRTIPQSFCLKSAKCQPPLHKGAFTQLTDRFTRLRVMRGTEGYARKMTTTGVAGGCVFMYAELTGTS